MTVRKRPVAVMQLPERFSRKEAQNFTREVERSMTVTRPYLVLDCSNVQHLDNSMVNLLLHCLEEAMKRNGDVKLAGVPVTDNSILGPAQSSLRDFRHHRGSGKQLPSAALRRPFRDRPSRKVQRNRF